MAKMPASMNNPTGRSFRDMLVYNDNSEMLIAPISANESDKTELEEAALSIVKIRQYMKEANM